jgi:hypothetical protein
MMSLILAQKLATLTPSMSTPPCRRLIGLTASFVHGKMENVPRQKARLCDIFGSAIFFVGKLRARSCSPIVKVAYQPTNMAEWTPMIEHTLERILVETKIKEAKKVLKRGSVVLEELGFSGFMFFVREGVIKQV